MGKNKEAAFKKSNSEDKSDFDPSDYMRARRPYLFSDSREINEPHLAKEVLEYYLESLTNRKQEYEFEHFCRKLAEKEIYPNILPQTGPTGGGDSKVDGETYPVADSIAIRWYEGIGIEASKERWAFAFSAKKKWKDKIRKDVGKIINTNREYNLIYFISNQFIKDKSRAEIEDELRKEYNVDIRILDRTWIVERVFENNRIQLAIDTLKLTEVRYNKDTVVGPRDYDRKEKLKQIEKDISDTDKYIGVEYQLAEECLQAALIARGLELPRSDIEGRFHRALRIAEEFKYPPQITRIMYNFAWTQYWWYDDYKELSRLYIELEKLVLKSKQSYEIGLLVNLWQCLVSSITRGKLTNDEIKIKVHTKKLKTVLYNLSNDKSRPSNALYSKSLRLMIDFNEYINTNKELDPIFKEYKEILLESEGLIEYPIDRDIKLIEEMGNVITDNPFYDELFELNVDIIAKRTNEGESGIALLKRGIQQLNADKNYEAIRLLGQAIQRLAKSEYQDSWTTALSGCSVAYEKVGLFWASRSCIIHAMNVQFSDIPKKGKVDSRLLFYIQRLIWLEIQLGRIPIVLAWIELSYLIAGQVKLNDKQKEIFLKESESQDFFLGLLLLKADFHDLRFLDFLPEILDKFKLFKSWLPLLYVLGYEDYLQKEKVIPENENSDDILEHFKTWLNCSASKELPDKPNFLITNTTTFCSTILGCDLCVETENDPVSIDLAEAILSALESFFATFINKRVFPHRSDFLINVYSNDLHKGVPKFSIDESVGGRIINVEHEKGYKKSTKEQLSEFQEWLWEFIVNVVGQLTIVADLDEFGKQVGEEDSIGRALSLSDVSTIVENIMGQKPRFTLAEWEDSFEGDRFVLLRDLPWDHGIKPEVKKESRGLSEWKAGKGEPPIGLFDTERLKHKDRKVISFINSPLWDQAEWQATGFIIHPNPIPYLIIAFNNINPGKQIFKEWIEAFGKVDHKDILRITIVTGINKSYPYHYRILVSANPDIEKGSQFLVMSKPMTMTPMNSRNLDMFLNRFKKIGEYILIPGAIDPKKQMLKPIMDLGIQKKEINVRPAWQIGINDQDISAIQEDDDPIIPSKIEDAPIVEVLNWIKKRRGR